MRAFIKKLLLNSFLATLFVFAVLVGILQLSQLAIFNAFDPLGKAFQDMEFTDIAFSNIRADPDIDTSIIIVNIGNLSRAEVAQQIFNINQGHPKVIGIDSFFDCPGGLRDSVNCPMAYDTLGNTMLKIAIEQAGNVVMVSKLVQSDSLLSALGDSDEYDSLEHTDEYILGSAFEGFANLDTDAADQEDLKACRRFNPAVPFKGGRKLAFATQIAMIYDSSKTERFLVRDKASEIINYRGNIVDWHGAGSSSSAGRYTTLDWDQALYSDRVVPWLFTNKIVLLGYLGADLRDTSWDDKFFTPLNKQYAGKSRPDMFGVVVHANIISMILHEDYVEELADWQKIAIAVIICFLNVALFWIIVQKIPDWFDGLSILLQLIQFLAYSFFIVMFLSWFSFKLELTTTLAVTAVVGTCFEIYYNVFLIIWARIKASKWFTRRREKVLTP